jgi:hypothetical protein
MKNASPADTTVYTPPNLSCGVGACVRINEQNNIEISTMRE